ncbi:MAG: hypothetical protein E6Q97_29925 [Desulfurellales bacterium]|nr:MAG: hypothetical protein E6Q97_29925 [Desulfurellales bacterium]
MIRLNVKSSLIWLALLLIALLGRCVPAHAESYDVKLLGPEVEIVDENGQAVANNTYTVECDGNQDLLISIEVRFVGGGVSLLTDEYCGSKIYIVGWIQLARIVAVASGPAAVYRLWLPAIWR